MILFAVVTAVWGIIAFGVAYTMATGTVPQLLRRKRRTNRLADVRIVENHVHPPFTAAEYARREEACGCSDLNCPTCEGDHSLTAVAGRLHTFIRCWHCEYRFKLTGSKRQYTSVHQALEAHDDQRALADYRAKLLEFKEYREMLVKRQRR